MLLFILYNVQLEIINFLNKNLRKAAIMRNALAAVQSSTADMKNDNWFKQNKMRKLIAAINMTLDGFCDHPMSEVFQKYNKTNGYC